MKNFAKEGEGVYGNEIQALQSARDFGGHLQDKGWTSDRYKLCVVDQPIHGADIPFDGVCEGQASPVFVTMVAFLMPAVS